MDLSFFSESNLNVGHGQTNQEIHQNNADENHEEKDHEMSREGKNCISILVDKILIFNLIAIMTLQLKYSRIVIKVKNKY